MVLNVFWLCTMLTLQDYQLDRESRFRVWWVREEKNGDRAWPDLTIRIQARRAAKERVRGADGLRPRALCILATYHWAFGVNVQRGDSPSRVKDFLNFMVTGALGFFAPRQCALIAPIAAADGFSRERIRTMMPTLLVTDLTASRIVVETFAARLLPGITLWLCLYRSRCSQSRGVASIPNSSESWRGLSSARSWSGSPVTLGLSLWSGQTFVALMGAYVLWGGLFWMIEFGFAPPRSWIAGASPYFLLFGTRNPLPGPGWADAGLFLGQALGATTVMLDFDVSHSEARHALVVAPRDQTASTLGGVPDRMARLVERLPGPTLDGNPVLWRVVVRSDVMGRTHFLAPCMFWPPASGRYFASRILGRSGRPAGSRGLDGLRGGARALGGRHPGRRQLVRRKERGPGGAGRIAGDAADRLGHRDGKVVGCLSAVPLIRILPFLSSAILATGAPTLPYVPAGLQPPVPAIAVRPIDRAAVPAVVLGQVLLYGRCLSASASYSRPGVAAPAVPFSRRSSFTW